MSPVGILAGEGLMPALGAAGVRERGRDVFIVDAGPEANESLPAGAPRERIPIWDYERVVDAFLQRGVRDVYVLGKLPASLISDPRLDAAARAVVAGAGRRSEREVIAAFVTDMTRRGLRIGSQAALLEPLLVPGGFAVAAEGLTDAQRRDLVFGFRTARALADDVGGGQTAVVKDGLVLALEAAEGTDAAIRRGGALGGPGVVVVKVKGRRTDDYDLPVVGMDTVRAAADVGAAALGMEAGKVFLLQRDAAAAAATRAGVALVAMRGGGDDR